MVAFDLCLSPIVLRILRQSSFQYIFNSNRADHPSDLREPFLPSLIAGLTYIAYKIWETVDQPNTLDVLLPALTTLIKPRSVPTDSSAIHSAVLSIVARPLDDALHHAQRRHPRRPDITPLLEALKPHAEKHRRDAAILAELETWSATPGGSLLAAIRNTVQSLILWSSPASAESSPPHYTHRQLTLTLQTLGAKPVLDTLIDELMLHVSPDLDTALDVIVTMISAPQAHFPEPDPTLMPSPLQPPLRHQLSLRDSLRMQFEDAYELSKKDVNRASMIVRLYRRVEMLVERGPPGAEQAGLAAGVGVGFGESTEVVKNAEGMPAVDIDDVLGQATGEQMAVAGFMAGGKGEGIEGEFMDLG